VRTAWKRSGNEDEALLGCAGVGAGAGERVVGLPRPLARWLSVPRDVPLVVPPLSLAPLDGALKRTWLLARLARGVDVERVVLGPAGAPNSEVVPRPRLVPPLPPLTDDMVVALPVQLPEHGASLAVVCFAVESVCCFNDAFGRRLRLPQTGDLECAPAAKPEASSFLHFHLTISILEHRYHLPLRQCCYSIPIDLSYY
jgi:hypothetical protein